MFTIEAFQMDTIIKKVYDEKVKQLFYHILINYELYKSTEEILDINMEKLKFYNFAKTQTCHATDGVFGDIKYLEYQFVYQLKVIGNLIVLITSAHRILTCAKAARAIEKSNDWKKLRDKINECDEIYDNKLRNFMEHLEEKIYKQKLTNENCQFSAKRILYCKDEKIDRQFDFNSEKLQIIDQLINDIIKMLSDREDKEYLF